jgi:hypothetical protein
MNFYKFAIYYVIIWITFVFVPKSIKEIISQLDIF